MFVLNVTGVVFMNGYEWFVAPIIFIVVFTQLVQANCFPLFAVSVCHVSLFRRYFTMSL